MTLGILLLGLGLALILAEVLLPSAGILSILATAAIIGSVVVAFNEDAALGVRFLVAIAILVPVVVMFGMRIFPKSPMGRKMVASGLSFRSRAATDERDLELESAIGVVESDCRPTGVARLLGRRVDVVSRGELIEKGEEVKVIEVSGNRVVVARRT